MRRIAAFISHPRNNFWLYMAIIWTLRSFLLHFNIPIFGIGRTAFKNAESAIRNGNRFTANETEGALE